MDSTIELQQLTLREMELELADPLRTSYGVRNTRRVLLVEARDAAGATAWAECVAFEDPGYLPETIHSARHVITRFIAPLVLGRRFDHPRDLHRLLETNVRGNPMARAAVEMAAWNVAAQKNSLPLARLLGGRREAVPTGIAIGIQPSLSRLRERTEQARAEGYRRIKLKIAPKNDIEPARTACEAVGAENVMLDANCAYSLNEIDTFETLDTLGLMMIEQPMGWDDLADHATLQRRLKTPICLDESLSGLARVRDMAALGSGRVVSIKPGRVGGLTESLAIHDFCVDHRIPVWCGGMLETGIGRAYNVALASLPGFTLPGDLSPSRRYWKRDIVDPEWEMTDDGFVSVPDEQPGIGVSVDSDRVERLTENRETLTAFE